MFDKKTLPTLVVSKERHNQGWHILKQEGSNPVLEVLVNIFCKLLSLELRNGAPVSPLLE